MEQEENEESLDTFKDTLLELLKDSAYIGITVGKKSNELLNKVGCVDLDINKLETVGLELLNMFNTVKGNMWAITESIEKNLRRINENRDEKVFKDLNSKLLEYKTHTVIVGSSNISNLSASSVKGLQADLSCDLPSVSSNTRIEMSSAQGNSDNEVAYKTQIETNKESENSFLTLKDFKETNTGSLSLKKHNDTQDTDDCWVDSMKNKSPSIMELWNRTYQGGDINATDDYLDKLKQEQEEEDRRNQKTPELNCDVDSSDDSFIDGRTPEYKKEIIKQSDSESLAENKGEIDFASEHTPQLEESFVKEENQLCDSYVVLDTARHAKKSLPQEDTDENNSASSIHAKYNSNSDISDSEIEKTAENPNTNDKSTDDELNIKTTSLDKDSGIELYSKSNNIPLKSVEQIEANADKIVTEKIINSKLNETEKSETLETKQNVASNSVELEELRMKEERELSFTEDTYRGPYSVETVKLDSDTEDIQSLENSDSEMNMATQPVSDDFLKLTPNSMEEQKKIFDAGQLNDSFISVLTEEIELDNTNRTEELVSTPNLIIEEESTARETERENMNLDIDNSSKDFFNEKIDVPVDHKLKQKRFNDPVSKELALDNNEDIMKSSDSDKNLRPSQSLTSKVDEAGAKQSLDSSNTPSSVLNSDKDENLSPYPIVLTNEIIIPKNSVDSSNLQTSNKDDAQELNKDSISSKYPVDPPHSQTSNIKDDTTVSLNPLASCRNVLNSDENVNLPSNSLISEAESSQAKHAVDTPIDPSSTLAIEHQKSDAIPLEFHDTQLSGTSETNLEKYINLSPNHLVSKDDPATPQSLTLIIEQVPDLKQSLESASLQMCDVKETNSNEIVSPNATSNVMDSDAIQTLAPPDIQSKALQDQVSEQSLNSSNPQFSGANESSLDKENLSLNACKLRIEACNAQSLVLALKGQETKQSLASPNTQSSGVEKLNSDELKNVPVHSPLASENRTADSSESIETPNILSPIENKPNLDKDTNLLPNSPASDSNSPDLYNSSEFNVAKELKLNEDINSYPNSTVSKDQAVDTQQTSNFSDAKELNSVVNVELPPVKETSNLSLESPNIQSVLTEAQQSPNPQSLEVNQNEKPNSEEDINMPSDSETIILGNSDAEMESDSYNPNSLENLEALDSQELQKSSSRLDRDQISKTSKQSFECESQSYSNATDICGNKTDVVNSNDINLKNKLDCDGEENLSQGSTKSFEFDISENLKDIDNDSDATISDIDFWDANSKRIRLSSEEFNSIGQNENDILKTSNKSEGIKEPIEIFSDSDDDVHLDVTMEEILSNGSPIGGYVSEPEVEKKEDFQDIKPLKSPENAFVNENLPGKENADQNSLQNGVGDELLELLREVEVPTVVNITDSNKIQKEQDKEEKNADEIFKMLQGESSLEISDSDLSEEDLNWDSNDPDQEILEGDADVDRNLDVQDKSTLITQELLNKHNIKECYVGVERLELNELDIVVVNKKLNDSIDRLCDINNIISKRKYSSTDLQNKLNVKRLKKAGNSSKTGTSDTESFSDISSSDSDDELHNDRTLSPILAAPLEQKLDAMLANEICKALKSNSGHESTDNESDDSRKSSKMKKIGDTNGEINDCAKVSKPILTKEEKERKAWKNDPLLREKLNSSSDTSTSSKETSKKIKKQKYEHDTDYDIVTDVIDSDSDNSVIYQQNKTWLQEKLISPIKKNVPLLSDSSDSDSDCEFVSQRQRTPQKNPNDPEAGPSCSQKGRRNIRALMSDENLAEATQRANKEEQERIERLEVRHKVKESFSQSFSQTDEEDLLILDVDKKLDKPLITVNPKLTKKLKPHQRIGIQFMWDSCYESVERLKQHDGSGCILAHCMGLGKTFQVLALIHTLFSHDVTNTGHVLVVCPLSTVNNWRNEIKIAFKDLPDEAIRVLTIADKRETSKKYEIVKKWSLRRKCVLVLGYEGFQSLTNEVKLEKAGSYITQRMLEALIDPGPDLVICDEGHLLRNKKALKTLALNEIKTKRRIVLTGTPLQNNLLEYYHMVQFVKPNLLGNMKEYKTNFVNPITNGQYEDSTEADIKLMLKRTHVLHKLLKKTIQRIEDTELKMYLPRMVDHAVFIQLHQVQVDLYNKFSDIIHNRVENTITKGFLSDFSIFQYIGTHPQLLRVMSDMRNKRIKERDLITNEKELVPFCNIDGWWKAKIPKDAAEKIEYGNKLVVVKNILEECEEIGDKLLVFSQSLGELDLIEHFLKKMGTAKCSSWQKKLDYFRMDGTIVPEDRCLICDKFNDTTNKRMRLLLMSTKVGGLGLNLTAANRVIIMTVNWNPSFDTQSVFRVYRFGQEKEVFVYRLISLDTMEEKVYQRTVTKLAVAHRVVDKHQITRHYKSMDLQELYSCKPNADEERPTPNVPEDKVLAKLLLKLPFIFKYHEHQALLANRPEDNLNEQELNAAWDEFKKIKDAPQIPPPLPVLPQFPISNGSTYADAYALSRLNVPSSANLLNMTINRVATGNELKEDHNITQYYIPKTSNTQQKSDRPVVSQMKNTNMKLNTTKWKQKPASSSNRVITLVDDPISDMIPLPMGKTTNGVSKMEQDPLYISEKSSKHSGTRAWTYYAKNKVSLPKLPVSPPLFLLDDSSNRSNQKENGNLVTTPRLSNASIVVDDNEHGGSNPKTNKAVLVENKSTVNKRKRKPDSFDLDKGFIKKKGKFHSNSSISLDDDVVINDTTSESGSLSNEIIQNLGRSGISVHKVMDDSKTNSDVITLD